MGEGKKGGEGEERNRGTRAASNGGAPTAAIKPRREVADERHNSVKLGAEVGCRRHPAGLGRLCDCVLL